MKQHLMAIVACLMMFLLSPVAFAEIKIGFVDVQLAILSTEQAKVIQAQINEEFKPEQDKIRQIQSEAAALIENLQKNAEVMSDAEKRKLTLKIEDKDNALKYEGQRLERQVTERQQELFTGIQGKLQKVIEDLVISDDYDVILPRQTALYTSDILDITRKVTEKLNQLDKPVN